MVFNIDLDDENLTEKDIIRIFSKLAIYCKNHSIGLCERCAKREIEKCLEDGEGIYVSNKFTGIPNDIGELEITNCTGFKEGE